MIQDFAMNLPILWPTKRIGRSISARFFELAFFYRAENTVTVYPERANSFCGSDA